MHCAWTVKWRSSREIRLPQRRGLLSEREYWKARIFGDRSEFTTCCRRKAGWSPKTQLNNGRRRSRSHAAAGRVMVSTKKHFGAFCYLAPFGAGGGRISRREKNPSPLPLLTPREGGPTATSSDDDPDMRRVPITPTLSPARAGRGGGGAQLRRGSTVIRGLTDKSSTPAGVSCWFIPGARGQRETGIARITYSHTHFGLFPRIAWSGRGTVRKRNGEI